MSTSNPGKTVNLRVGGFIKVKTGVYEVMHMEKVERTYISQRDSDEERVMYSHLSSIVFLKPPEIDTFEVGDIVTQKEQSVRLRQVGDVPSPLTLYLYKIVTKEKEDDRPSGDKEEVRSTTEPAQPEATQ